MYRKQIYPIAQALLAALFFGASAPIAKVLLGDVEPIPLAGFLYLGSGISLLIVKLIQRTGGKTAQNEAGIKKSDIGWLAGAVFAGGVAAPIVLLFSLRVTPASTASLLLNFESIATTLIAALVFKEGIHRRAWGAIILITLASILLSINSNQEWGLSLGALGILAACLLWGMDNNFTNNISAKDPLVIVTVKGLAAGSFSLIIGLTLGNQLPNIGIALKAMLLGSISYGLSIVLFVYAMRGLGAARTSALFGIAPLAGMFLSLILLRENFNLMLIVAFPLTLAGTLLLVNEKHDHHHVHDEILHEHSHSHDDEHHDHNHDKAQFDQPHSHPHFHAGMKHSHHHMPDLHHRHTHASD